MATDRTEAKRRGQYFIDRFLELLNIPKEGLLQAT